MKRLIATLTMFAALTLGTIPQAHAANECMLLNKTASEYAEYRLLLQFGAQNVAIENNCYTGSNFTSNTRKINAFWAPSGIVWLDLIRTWTTPQVKSGSASVEYEYDTFPGGNWPGPYQRWRMTCSCGTLNTNPSCVTVSAGTNPITCTSHP